MSKNISKANALSMHGSTHITKAFMLCALLFAALFAMLVSSQAFATVDTTTKADQQAAVIRVAGNESADTAAEIASQTYSSSKWVVIARDDDFADAMSATGLAGTLDAPILLTGREALSNETLERIESLGADSAYIIGGKGAIPGDLESQLDAIGVTTHERIFGNEYWETSIECAKYIKSNGGNPNKEAIVAMGTNFQDALSISSYAYANKIPIFLETDANNGRNLTESAQNAIWDIVGNNNTIYVPGGPGAVKTETVEGVFDSEGQKSRVKRMYGENGFDTSKAIAETLVSEEKLSAKTVVIANGAEGPKGTDALAGAALAGKNGGVILLANSNEGCGDVSTVTLDDFLSAASNAKQVENAYILGGTYVMPNEIMTTTQSALWKWAKVTFSTNAGSSVDTQSIWNGAKIDAEKATTTRDGYTFVNWSTNANLVGGEVDLSKLKVKTSTVLYANWAAADGSTTYSVRFNSNGGTSIPTQTVISGKTATEPSAISRDGYAFQGWYTDEALTNPYDFDTEITGDVTLYAKWAVKLSGVLNARFDTTAILAIAEVSGVQSGAELTYQWYRQDEEGNLTPIEGASMATFSPADEDMGNKLVVQATDTLTGSYYGSLEGSLVVPTSQEDPENPNALSGNVLISGTPSVGSTLVATASNMQDGVKPAYQWYVLDSATGNKTAIAWAKGETYTPTAQDCGKQLVVEVTDASSKGRQGSISANVSIPANLPIGGIASISTDESSGKLTAEATGMQSDVSAVYQWYTVNLTTGDKTPIDGATKKTYTPTIEQAGSKIAVEITDGATNGHTGALSAQTVVAGGGTKQIEGSLTIVGTLEIGQTLRVQTNGIQESAQPAYAWYKVDPTTGAKTIIKNANTNRFNITASDSGMTFIVEVTDATSGGYTGSISAQVNIPVIQYNVTFDTQGGSEVATQAVNCNTSVTKPTNPTYEGYAFMGWYTDKECTQVFDFASKVTQDVTLYAKWVVGNVASYSVAHYRQNSDGSYPNAASLTESFEGTIGSQTTATVRDYSNQGYQAPESIVLNQQSIANDGSTIVKIYYPRKSYTVLFDSNGHGSSSPAQTVLYGAVATSPSLDNVEGYTFYGWYKDAECSQYSKYNFESMVRSDLTLYAKWVSDFSGNVSIEGTVAVGKKLTASVDSTPSDATLAYQWCRDGEEISGATSSTYTPTSQDLGCSLTVKVSDGKAVDPHVGSIESKPTSRVLNSQITGGVTISGDVVSGEQLTANANVLQSDITTLAYQWYRGDEAIEGATEQTYTLTAADEGFAIKVVVTDGASTNPHYGELTSVETTKVARIPLSGSLEITGKVEEGGTISAVLTLDPTQTDVVPAYQWYRDGKAIEGEIRTTHYIDPDNDFGHTFYVTVTDASATPHLGTITSAETEPVTRTYIQGTVSVEGTAAVGETLTATVTGTQVDATPLVYQWCYVGDSSDELVDIPGATEATYEIAKTADFNPVGKQIVCKVTDGSALPHGSFIQSTPTLAVTNTIITGNLQLSPSGTCAVGTQLSAVATDLPADLTTPTYEWVLRAADGTEKPLQSGTDKTTYTPKETDKGSFIVVRLTDSATLGYSGNLEAQTETVVSKEAISGTVTVSGTCAIGETVTASVTGTPEGVWKSYQWYRDDKPVEGAQRKTYTLTDADAGHTIIVKVSDANPDDPYSRTIDAKAGSLDKLPLTGTVEIEGVLATRQTLTAVVTNLPEDVEQSALKYQWCISSNDGTLSEISDATEKTYIAKATDKGKKIVCKVTDGTTPLAHSGSIQSAATPVIRVGYSITYNLGCEDTVNSSANPTGYITEEGLATLEPATRPGYTFEGWYDSSNTKVESISAGTEKNIQLTAKFAPTPTSSKENKGDYWLSAETTKTYGTTASDTGLTTITSSNGRFTYTIGLFNQADSTAIADAMVALTNVGSIIVTMPDGSEATVATVKVSTDASQEQPKQGVSVTVEFGDSYVSGETNETGVFDAKSSEVTKGKYSGRVTVKTSSELDSDIQKIKNGDEATIALYNCYLHNEDVNLETEVANASGELESMLFRIIEVGQHDSNEGLTFQSTTLINSSAYSVNSTVTNDGGWEKCELRKSMNNLEGASEKNIWSLFKTSFTNKILAVPKKSGKGYNTNGLTETSDKFWLPSYAEITGNLSTNFQDGEGRQYAWYKNVANVSPNNNNSSIALPLKAGQSSQSWWTRSAYTTFQGAFAVVNSNGYVPIQNNANVQNYVAPCFAM